MHPCPVTSYIVWEGSYNTSSQPVKKTAEADFQLVIQGLALQQSKYLAKTSASHDIIVFVLATGPSKVTAALMHTQEDLTRSHFCFHGFYCLFSQQVRPRLLPTTVCPVNRAALLILNYASLCATPHSISKCLFYYRSNNVIFNAAAIEDSYLQQRVCCFDPVGRTIQALAASLVIFFFCK